MARKQRSCKHKPNSRRMKHFAAWCIGWLLCWTMLFAMPVQAAAQPVVHQLEVQSAPGIDRVILHLSDAVVYKSFGLDNPPRIVVDMPTVEWRASQGLPPEYKGGLLRNIRVAQFNPTTTRMVFDLTRPARLEGVTISNTGGLVPQRLQFSLVEPDYKAEKPVAVLQTPSPKTTNKLAPPEAKHNHSPAAIRSSAVPLVPSANSRGDWVELAEKAAQPKSIPASLPFSKIPVPEFRPQPYRKPMVVIDAGHGGRDPGARGVKGTNEKDVTLRYVHSLRDALLKTGRYDVFLTREDDTYVMLRERLALGRRAKGDIFISIHADSAENHDTRGLSIYTLSETASDKEAAALAARENKVDIIYGMNLSSETPDVTEILIDLAQRETRNKSWRLAETLVGAVKKKVKLLPNTHRQAGFAVLKAPDVPSVLIELGFLSNRRDEALITSRNYREEVVNGLVRGIDAYFAQRKS